MKHTMPKGKNPKNLLKQAKQAASKGEPAKSYMMFEACIKDYLSCQMPLKALAAAKHAKTVLGSTPKIRAL
ncbi:MAG: hypothetical protein JXM72_08050, partial [Deltaproteobacteria bacterium]|nr:hypothetical protein [Deltaproteobacteria bacterium]